MRKYFQIFSNSIQTELVYRTDFIFSRVANITQLLVTYFLWTALFMDKQLIFGYDKHEILTYVFAVLIIRSLTMVSKTSDLAGEIAGGEISNYIVKPINYIGYWLSRDVSAKIINVAFAVFEIYVLFYLLKPDMVFQSNPVILLMFILSLVISSALFFLISFLVNTIAFWMPENGWAAQYLFVVVILDFLSGSVFPLDIFPESVKNIFFFLPFQYILYYPIQIYLGRLPTNVILSGFLISIGWLSVIYLLVRTSWKEGMKTYAAEGI